MKKVLLKSLSVISPKLKKAKIINFDDRLTILTSEKEDGTTVNHTGKSLIIKSIYHALGAKLSKYTKNWNELNIVTMINFSYNGQCYCIFRNGNSFIIENEQTGEIIKNNSVSELKEYYVKKFNIGLKLLLAKPKDDDIKYNTPYPSALFLPYYIDQDVGWDGRWKSFPELSMYKDYKKEIFSFHTGLRTNEYYEGFLEKIQKQTEIDENTKLIDKYKVMVKDNIARYKEVIDINIDINEFSRDLDILINQLNSIQEEKQIYKEKLLKKNNEKLELTFSLNNIQEVLKELNKDVDFINCNIKDNVVSCPTCGTILKNTLSTRYLMNLDVEECEEKIEKYTSQITKVNKEIDDLESKMKNLNKDFQGISVILNRKRNTIKLQDALISFGIKDYLVKLNTDIEKLIVDNDSKNEEIKKITKNLKQIEKKSSKIKDAFNTNINLYISNLGITDIEISKKKKIGEIINSGGSDLARATLGYVFSYFNLIVNNDQAVIFPIVIDTPLQQEQSTESTEEVFNLLLDNAPKEAQVIVATTNTYGRDNEGKKYSFLKKQSVLNEEDYRKCEQQYFKYLSLLSGVND